LQLVAATKMAEQTIITAAVESDLPVDLNSTKFYVTAGQVRAGK
jgi:DNA replication and repair protein RecF